MFLPAEGDTEQWGAVRTSPNLRRGNANRQAIASRSVTYDVFLLVQIHTHPVRRQTELNPFQFWVGNEKCFWMLPSDRTEQISAGWASE